MSMFNLERETKEDSHVTCPECQEHFRIVWDTEYHDPIVGEHDAVCPVCRKAFRISCYTQYNAWRINDG